MSVKKAGAYRVGRFSWIDTEGGNQAVMLTVFPGWVDRDTDECVLLLSASQALDLAAALITEASATGSIDEL